MHVHAGAGAEQLLKLTPVILAGVSVIKTLWGKLMHVHAVI